MSLCRCERRATVVANKGDALTSGTARGYRVQAINAEGGCMAVLAGANSGG
ncbi:MAG: hypothetical protein ACO3GE_02460 [Steroidobacteraceae bacterium]